MSEMCVQAGQEDFLMREMECQTSLLRDMSSIHSGSDSEEEKQERLLQRARAMRESRLAVRI